MARRKTAQIETVRLTETRNSCPPGATIIDVDFAVVAQPKGKTRGKRKKRSIFALIVFTLLALALGGLAGFFAPAMLAEAWRGWV